MAFTSAYNTIGFIIIIIIIILTLFFEIQKFLLFVMNEIFSFSTGLSRSSRYICTLQLYFTSCSLSHPCLPDRFKYFLLNIMSHTKLSLHLDEFVHIKTGLQVCEFPNLYNEFLWSQTLIRGEKFCGLNFKYFLPYVIANSFNIDSVKLCFIRLLTYCGCIFSFYFIFYIFHMGGNEVILVLLLLSVMK